MQIVLNSTQSNTIREDYQSCLDAVSNENGKWGQFHALLQIGLNKMDMYGLQSVALIIYAMGH